MSPFDSLTFDNVTGIFSVDNVTSPIQANNTTVAELVLRLSGNCTISYDFAIAFNIIGAASDPGLNIPEEHPNSITLLRGVISIAVGGYPSLILWLLSSIWWGNWH